MRLTVRAIAAMLIVPWISAHAAGHVFTIDRGDQPADKPDHAKAVKLTAEGNVTDTFGTFGKAPGQFQMGHDIAVARDGSVYVAEGKGKRVQKFARKTAEPSSR